jgi:uncharacterized membrane protein
MSKKILLTLLLFSSLFVNIFAVPAPAVFNANLNTVVNSIPYTLALKYADTTYNSEPIVNGTFNDEFTSLVFTVELSDGNELSDLQFTIKIIPGTFIRVIENEGDEYFDTQFKPTPTLETLFPISSSFYDANNKILSITSIIIPAGKNTVQPIAKFYLGWDANDETLPQVNYGIYLSTTTVEYTTEVITSSSSS